MRATAFITGGWLPDERRGQEMNALMHVTDWLPTLVSIAGFEVDDQNKIDGYDQSSNIRYNLTEYALEIQFKKCKI